ncbi:MAG: adenosylcobinamide-GDP ribazoletransferase [Lachnospiraceae bacterium]|nr:adenosylcobinamide-GDP ribazoletransferase [Lachnospiraceae bacterium]
MVLINAILTAFSTYSSIPVPKVKWDEKNLKYSMCAFPLIGIVIGLISRFWIFISDRFIPSPILKALILTLIPLWISGGIHLDGFIDVSDALSSHASKEKKHDILKDPHMGAFAAIHLVSIILLNFSAFASFKYIDPTLLLLIYTLSRCLSGYSVVTFPVSKNSTLLKTYSDSSDRKNVQMILTVFSLTVIFLMMLRGPGGILSVMAALIILAVYRQVSVKEFGGINGDMAGWFLCIAETAMILITVISQFLF